MSRTKEDLSPPEIHTETTLEGLIIYKNEGGERLYQPFDEAPHDIIILNHRLFDQGGTPEAKKELMWQLVETIVLYPQCHFAFPRKKEISNLPHSFPGEIEISTDFYRMVHLLGLIADAKNKPAIVLDDLPEGAQKSFENSGMRETVKDFEELRRSLLPLVVGRINARERTYTGRRYPLSTRSEKKVLNENEVYNIFDAMGDRLRFTHTINLRRLVEGQPRLFVCGLKEEEEQIKALLYTEEEHMFNPVHGRMHRVVTIPREDVESIIPLFKKK